MKTFPFFGVLVCLLLIFAPTAWAQDPPTAFVTETIYDSPNGITALEFDHAGRMLAIEKQGRILAFEPDGSGGFLPPRVFATLPTVRSDGEMGLLGLALDPDYALNGHLYVCYTTISTAGRDQRVTRLTADSTYTQAVPGSEVVVLSGLPRAANNHKAGDLHFSPSDPNVLFLTLGDDGNNSDVVRDLNRYEGKLLRFDKRTGRGLSDNPFFDGDANSARSRIWAMGFRNPFRFTFHPNRPTDSALYSSENGSGTDKLSLVRPGSDGRWGTTESQFLNTTDPNHKVLKTQAPSVVGLAISTSGPFGTDVVYWGRVDSSGGDVFRYQLTGTDLDSVVALDGGAFVSDDMSTIDMSFGPDGLLYGTSCGGDESTNGSWPIRRIRPVASLPPVASFATSPDPAVGEAPLTVTFTDQSIAPGSSITQWSWDFGDGATDSVQNPIHTYTTPGVRVVKLTVTNEAGQQSTIQRDVVVRRTVELTLTTRIYDARSEVDVAAPLSVATELRFYQADGTTPLEIVTGIGPNRNAVAVAAGGSITGNLTLLLEGESFVVSAGEPDADAMQWAKRGFRVTGAPPYVLNEDFYLSDTMIVGRVRDTTNWPLAVDVGVRRLGEAYAVPGGRDYLPGTRPLTGTAHRTLSDALGWFHFPIRSGSAPAEFTVDAVADTETASHAAVSVARALGAGSLERIDLTSGLWFGGEDCADLSAIAPTPQIDYASQIQPIWNLDCIGCHTSTATNVGGLDLTTGNSLRKLMSRTSSFAPGVARVQPGQASRSFLMEKINCQRPQAGTRMRPTDSMPLELQALIRDWINQSGQGNFIYGDGFD